MMPDGSVCCRTDTDQSSPCSLGMVHSFLTFLDLDHPNNRVYNIRVCNALVQEGFVTDSNLSAHRVIPKARESASVRKLSPSRQRELWSAG